MMEILEYIFGSFWRFIGAVVIIEIVISPLQILAERKRKK